MLMNEITKLYENAGVEPIDFAELGAIDFTGTIEIKGKRYFDFTPEKQLEIIKLVWWVNLKRLQFSEKFDEGLAQLINELWQKLTEEEKEQIKGILEWKN